MNVIAEPLTFDFEPTEIWTRKPPKRGGEVEVNFNNCEHFANACTLGKYRSRQIENFFRR